MPEQDYRTLFKRYYEDRDRLPDHYKERVLCYECSVSLDAQIWYAASSNTGDYAWMRERTLQLLERGIARA